MLWWFYYIALLRRFLLGVKVKGFYRRASVSMPDFVGVWCSGAPVDPCDHRQVV